MCRWIAYIGEPILIEQLVTKPRFSLLYQSQHARKTDIEVNADGFGVGWYDSQHHAGLFKDTLPAWSDENLKSLCAHIRSGNFFAHIRATTGTEVSRLNCHPFTLQQWLFMHNGLVNGYDQIRRPMEHMIPDHLYPHRRGNTDSEVIFLSVVALLEQTDMISAVTQVLKRILDLQHEHRLEKILRFTAAMSDGENTYVFRFSSDPEPPSLYYCHSDTGTIIVSEPLDSLTSRWQKVKESHALIAKPDGSVQQHRLPIG